MNFEPAYFTVTATLMPVLFLALVVEDRFKSADDGPLERVVRTAALASLIVGEAAALIAVATGEPSVLAGVVVSGALPLVGLLIVSPVVVAAIEDATSRAERIATVAIGAVVVMVLVAVIGGLLLAGTG